jgi:hypothetical protein
MSSRCRETARRARNRREEAIVTLLRNAKVVTDQNKLAFLKAEIFRRKTRSKSDTLHI